MEYSGNLSKMRTLHEDTVRYFLTLGEDEVEMNELIGQQINIVFEGQINCKVCGRKIKKTFGEGFCYPDFMNHPLNSPCILRPELCEGHVGIGRDLEWEKEHHVKPHVVYLALSSGVKVGVTREDQVPTRWMDQGASKAVRLAETPYRQLAGNIEVALKAHISDKTHWQKMLKNDIATHLSLSEEKERLIPLIPEELQSYVSSNAELWEFNYPVEEYPVKVKSMKLDKLPEIEGKLKGIKGQYLIFDEGRVMNIRSHTGYFIKLSI